MAVSGSPFPPHSPRSSRHQQYSTILQPLAYDHGTSLVASSVTRRQTTAGIGGRRTGRLVAFRQRRLWSKRLERRRPGGGFRAERRATSLSCFCVSCYTAPKKTSPMCMVSKPVAPSEKLGQVPLRYKAGEGASFTHDVRQTLNKSVSCFFMAKTCLAYISFPILPFTSSRDSLVRIMY